MFCLFVNSFFYKLVHRLSFWSIFLRSNLYMLIHRRIYLYSKCSSSALVVVLMQICIMCSSCWKTIHDYSSCVSRLKLSISVVFKIETVHLWGVSGQKCHVLMHSLFLISSAFRSSRCCQYLIVIKGSCDIRTVNIVKRCVFFFAIKYIQ